MAYYNEIDESDEELTEKEPEKAERIYPEDIPEKQQQEQNMEDHLSNDDAEKAANERNGFYHDPDERDNEEEFDDEHEDDINGYDEEELYDEYEADMEDDFEAEYPDDYEEEFDPDEIDEPEEQSVAMPAVDYYGNEAWRHGVLGTIIGAVSGIIAVAMHLVRVAVSTLLFDSNERMDIYNVFARQMAKSTGSKMDEKKTDASVKENDKGTSQEKDQGKEYENRTENKEERRAGEENLNKNRQETEYTKESTEEAVKMMLNHQDIRKIYKNIGLDAYAQKNTDNIILFQTVTKGDLSLQKRFCSMSKQDLLNGKGESLASALYAYEKKPDEMSADALESFKMKCGAKALVTVAMARYLANTDEFRDAQMNGEFLELGSIRMETRNGAVDLSVIASDEYKNVVDICYNGSPVVSIPIWELTKQPFEKYEKNIMAEIEKACQVSRPIEVGDIDKLKFEKTQEGIHVTAGDKDMGSYSFQTEADIKTLLERMEQEKIRPQNLSEVVGDQNTGYRLATDLDVKAIVYTAAVIFNPDMQPIRDSDGKVLNTFTGEPEPDGKAHFFSEHTEDGVNFKLFYPKPNTEFNELLLGSYFNSQNISQDQFMKLANAVSEGTKFIDTNTYIDPVYNRECYYETKTHGDQIEIPIVTSETEVKETVQEANREFVLDGMEAEYDFPIINSCQAYDEKLTEEAVMEQMQNVISDELAKQGQEIPAYSNSDDMEL